MAADMREVSERVHIKFGQGEEGGENLDLPTEPETGEEIGAEENPEMGSEENPEMDSDERTKLPGVSANRARQIVAGALVTESVMRNLDLEKLEICPWALREGLILKYMDWTEH